MNNEIEGTKVRRCPSCHSLDLRFTNNQFICSKCGFVQKLPLMRRVFDKFKR